MAACTINPIKINAVNRGTAKLCHDYNVPGQRIHSDPDPTRPFMRLLVVLGVVAATVLAIIYIAEDNKSGVQVKKVKNKPLNAAKENFPALPAGSIIKAGPQPSPNLTCPCQTPTSYHWCKFINISLIVCNKETNYKPEVTWISTTNDNCIESPQNLDNICQYFDKNLQDACTNAVHTAFNFIRSSQMPHIQTPMLSTSLDLHDRVAEQMLASIDTKNQTTYNSTKNINQTVINGTTFNPATLYEDAMLGLLLLQSMVLQVFDCKTNSTPQEFWDRGITCGWNVYPQIGKRMNETKFVFGMAVDYDAYSTQCNPSYCYILQDEGLTRRFMYAFAEVGGTWSVIALGIRFILWPLVAMIFRFPHAPSLDPTKICRIQHALAADS